MKRLVALLCLAACALLGGPRKNLLVTIAAGTPVQVSTLANSGCPANGACMVNRIFIQALLGGSGVVYVMDMSSYIANTVPSHSTAGNLTAQLAAATASAPGGSYSDTADSGSGAIDISAIWIDGSNTSDTVVVSFDRRN
jgi:hypothetical protein